MQSSKAFMLFASMALLSASPLLFASSDTPDQPWSDNLKTHLTPRAILAHLPHEYAHWHDAFYKPTTFGAPKTHFLATGFFRETTNGSDVGEHFGSSKGCNGLAIGTTASLTPAPRIFGDRSYMMRRTTGPITQKGGITYKPRQIQGGVRFDLHHDIVVGSWDKLFVQMSTPLVYVENKLGTKICDDIPTEEKCGSLLQKFFDGRYEQLETNAPGNSNLQSALTKAKIRNINHRLGFADISFNLGYKYYETECTHLFLKAKMIVPTGNKETGEYVFDAVYGNGGHFGLGWQVDAATTFDLTDFATAKFMAAFSHTYLFEANEMRTPSIMDASGNFTHGQYYLAGRLGQVDAALFPAANVITQKMRIKPGHQLEALIAGSFKSSDFVIDAGYNMYWKDREDAWIKNWKDGVYALAKNNFNTAGELSVGASKFVIDKINLNTSAVETPALFSHTVYASLGYNLSFCKKRSLLLSVGGSYELGTTRATFDAYTLWLKTGVSF